MAHESKHNLKKERLGYIIRIEKDSRWAQKVTIRDANDTILLEHIFWSSDGREQEEHEEDFSHSGEIFVEVAHMEPEKSGWRVNRLLSSKPLHEGRLYYSEWEDGGGRWSRSSPRASSDIWIWFKVKG